MKTPILHSSIAAALAGCALPTVFVSSAMAADVPDGAPVDGPSRQQKEQLERVEPKVERATPDLKLQSGKPQQITNSSSSSVITNGDGTATVTIEVNGKKDTRTFKLGDEPFTLKLKDAHGEAGATVSGGKETWIGIGVGGSVSDEVRAQLPIQPGEGVTVLHVAPGSPAEKAGLAQHDILVRLDDQVLVEGDQFKKLVRMHKPGESVKIGYFRKGERKDVQVALEEHEVVSEPQDVLKWIGDPSKWKDQSPEKWQERLHLLREKSGAVRDRLREVKEKLPGVIVDKQAFVVGVDGTVKKIEGELANVEAVVKNLREQLEKANVPKETIDEIRKAVEKAIDKTGDAARNAVLDAVREVREKHEAVKKEREASKLENPAQPVQPAPPIKTPQ